MAGNSNSGRKSWDKELDSKKLWDLSIPVLIYALRTKSKKLPMFKRIDVALALVSKMLPQQVESIGSNETKIIIINPQGYKPKDERSNQTNRVESETKTVSS